MDFPDFLANEEPLLAGCTPVFSGARILDRPPHGIVLALANIMTRLPIQYLMRIMVPHFQVSDVGNTVRRRTPTPRIGTHPLAVAVVVAATTKVQITLL